MKKLLLIPLLAFLFFPNLMQSQCAPYHPGYINIGQFNGSNYYLSTTDARPTDAQAAAEALGGYLAVIDNEEEDNFLLNYIDELTYIGLNDAAVEGTFEWLNGDPVGYTNIDPCSFCTQNSEDQDYVVMEPWGTASWSFSNFWNARKYMVEIPCGTSSTDCAFSNVWENQNFFYPGTANNVIETTDGFEMRFEGFGTGTRRLTKWFLDPFGQTTSTSDIEIPYPTGMDFGRYSTLGDYFFMHDVAGLNPQLLKYDFSGNVVWTKTYVVNTTVPNLNYTASRDSWEDADGILITGHSGNGPNGVRQPFLIKTDLDGNELWQKLLPDEDRFLSLGVVQRSGDGGYYLRMTLGTPFPEKIIKIDANGNLLWTHETTGNVNNVERIFPGESADGTGFFYTQYVGFSTTEIKAVKLNTTTGAVAWEKNVGDEFGQSFPTYKYIHRGALAMNDGGLVVHYVWSLTAGNGTTFDDFGNHIGKFDANGNIVWEHEMPRYQTNFHLPSLTTSDNGILFSGASQNDKKFVWKYTSEGWNAPVCGNAPTGFQVNCDLNIAPDGLQVEPSDPTGKNVIWSVPTGSTDCPGGITVQQISGPISGEFLLPWTEYTIVYEVSDNCGNSETCTTTIQVSGIEGSLICPSDIVVDATSPDGAIVFFDDAMPSVTSCLADSPQVVSGLTSGSLFPVGTTEVEFSSFFGGSNFGCQNFEVCTFTVTVNPPGGGGGGCPGDIAGFTTIGEYGDSKYYLSNDAARAVDAQVIAESNGGYLAAISSQEENDFIQQGISEMTYIGLNDETLETELEWFNGEPFTFNNINPCGFCNENSEDQDYVIMAPWDGAWSFSNFWNSRKYVMEIPCNGGGGVECSFTSTISTTNAGSNVSISEMIENNAGYELVTKDVDNTISRKVFTYQLDKSDGTFLNSDMTQMNLDPNVNYGSIYWDRINNKLYSAKLINEDVVLTKYDEQGNVIFTNTIEVIGIDFYGSPSVRAFDDAILITGNSGPTSNLPLIKTDVNGEVIWIKQLNLGVDSGTSGGIYGESKLGGYFLNYWDGGPHIVKIDVDGNVESINNNGTTDPPSEKRFVVGESGDGSAFYLGRNSNNSWRAFVTRYEMPNGNATGLNLGESFAGGTNAYTSRHLAGIPTNDGGYVVFYSYALGFNPSNPQAYLYERYDADWNLVWSYEWTPFMTDMFSNGANFTSLATADGGFLLGYETGADEYTVVRMTSEGLFEPDCGGGSGGGDLPDLTVSNLTNFPSSTETGVVVSFNFDLNNIGTATASGDYWVNMYISTDEVLSTDDIMTGEIFTGDTPVGTISNVPGSVGIPTLSDGTYFLIIVADDFEEIEESNEDNNTLTAAFEITSGGGGGNCPTTLAGYTSLGEFNGSAYFLSNDVARPIDGQAAAEAVGGNLATIDSQAENDFLYPQIGELAYIGLNDYTTENTLEWFSGDAVNYTNFDICGFCNGNSEDMDFVVMHSWNGGWSWSNFYNNRKFIVEIPCSSTLTNPNINNVLISETPPVSENVNILLEKVYPNPTEQFIFATIQSQKEQTVDVQIFDARGSMKIVRTIDLFDGKNVIEFSVADLPSGFYTILIPQAEGKNSTQRFIKVGK